MAYIKDVTLPSGSSTPTQGDQYTTSAGTVSSGGKDTNNFDTFQENSEKSSENEESGVSFQKVSQDHKQAQLDIITSSNPMLNDYHTGIREVGDLLDFAIDIFVHLAGGEDQKIGVVILLVAGFDGGLAGKHQRETAEEENGGQINQKEKNGDFASVLFDIILCNEKQ